MLSTYSKNSPSSYPDKSFMHLQGNPISDGSAYYAMWNISHITVDGVWHGLYHTANNSQLTMMFWAKWVDGNYLHVLYESGGIQFGISSDGYFNLQLQDTDTNPDKIYIRSHDMSNDATRWKHYAVTWDNSGGGDSADDMIVYIDGKDVSTKRFTDAGFGTDGDDNQSIFHGCKHAGGGISGSTSQHMKDPISDFVIYDTALSASDIKAIASTREGFHHKHWNKGGNLFSWIDYADTDTIINTLGTNSYLTTRKGGTGSWGVTDVGISAEGAQQATRFLRGPTTK